MGNFCFSSSPLLCFLPHVPLFHLLPFLDVLLQPQILLQRVWKLLQKNFFYTPHFFLSVWPSPSCQSWGGALLK